MRRSFYDRFLKRGLDVLFSFFGLILLSPVFLIVALCVYFDDPGPVFFRQERIGIHKTRFTAHKFRSMKTAAPHDTATHLLSDPGAYITRVGGFLRRSSLDELPQFYDIFIGKMSFIGPRPALWNQDDLVRERDRYGANDIRPGLSGWAQINGRDAISIEEKARLDGEYTKALCLSSASGFLTDVRILFRTFKATVTAENVIEGQEAETTCDNGTKDGKG